MKAILGTCTAILLFLFAAIGIQNPTVIALRLFNWQTPALPLWVLLLLALASGMLLVGIFALPRQLEAYVATRRQQRQQNAAAQRPLMPINAAASIGTMPSRTNDPIPNYDASQTEERHDPMIDAMPKRTL